MRHKISHLNNINHEQTGGDVVVTTGNLMKKILNTFSLYYKIITANSFSYLQPQTKLLSVSKERGIYHFLQMMETPFSPLTRIWIIQI